MKKRGLISLVFFLNALNASNISADVVNTPATAETTPPPISETKPKPVPQYTINFITPADEQTFQSGESSITATVAVSPALEAEDTVVIYVDGAAATNPINSTSIVLPELERGEHTLQAKILQPKGAGAISPTITVYQQRASQQLPKTRG